MHRDEQTAPGCRPTSSPNMIYMGGSMRGRFFRRKAASGSISIRASVKFDELPETPANIDENSIRSADYRYHRRLPFIARDCEVAKLSALIDARYNRRPRLKRN